MQSGPFQNNTYNVLVKIIDAYMWTLCKVELFVIALDIAGQLLKSNLKGPILWKVRFFFLFDYKAGLLVI